MNIKLSEKLEYVGEYRDIRFSIIKFPNPIKDSDIFDSVNESKFSWCHYIYLNLDEQIESEEIRERLWLEPYYSERGRCHYSYYDSIINDIDFHGGCTFYSKETSEDEKFRCVKIGCDYQHLFDSGRNYSLDYVKDEVKQTIDSFLKNVSPVLKHCSGCGVYYKDVTKDGCGKCKYSKDKY